MANIVSYLAGIGQYTLQIRPYPSILSMASVMKQTENLQVNFLSEAINSLGQTHTHTHTHTHHVKCSHKKFLILVFE